MIKIDARAVFLYFIGIVLLLFGYPTIWEEIKAQNLKKTEIKRQQEEAKKEASKKFEVQPLVLDSTSQTWKNTKPYFQIIHVGNINFKALQIPKKTTIETHDDENASDSF